jgi:uncharacterized membrane protein YgcG
MNFLKVRVLICLFILLTSCKGSKDDIPILTGPVMDPSGFLPAVSKAELETILLSYQKETTHQIVVYITPKLQFDTIENEAVLTFEKWKLGLKGKDNGVLYLLAPKERKVRIEVGYGLESVLTDITTKRIIDEIIIPKMKSGEIANAVKQGSLAIINQINADTPTLLSKSCPEAFSDQKDLLHRTTIPLLQKNIKSRKALNNYDIRFCVSDVSNELSLEAQAYGILKNIDSTTKSGLVFLTAMDESGNYFGKIASDPKLSWVLSENNKTEIFRHQYSFMREGDMTNYSYNAMLETLDQVEKWEATVQKVESRSGLQDTYSALVPFATKNVTQSLEKIETDLKLPVSVLLLKTSKDLVADSKKFHSQIFKNGNGILLLISLNEKDLSVFTNENTVFPFSKKESASINNAYLTDQIKFAVRSYLAQGDIDWIATGASESLYSTIKGYYPISENPANLTTNSIESKAIPSLWNGIRAFLAFFGLLSFLALEGIPFFTILFYLSTSLIRDRIPFLNGEFSYLVKFLLLLASAFISYLFVILCRKLNLATPVTSFLQNVSTSLDNLGSVGGSYSSSSSRSSSSSYSGGGGRSGGGGASGSW